MYKLKVNSDGQVVLELQGIPTEVEKKEIEKLIAPDGYVMATYMNRIKALGLYTEQSVQPKTATPEEIKVVIEPKKKGVRCSKCNNGWLNNRSIVSERQAGYIGKRLNKEVKVGDAFRQCSNKDCGLIEE